MNICDYIPMGRNNAISSVRLANKTGLSPRELRKIVSSEREEGAAICSCSNGYYKPVSVNEALTYYCAQLKRVKSGNIALKSIRRYIECEGNREQWERLEQIEREL